MDHAFYVYSAWGVAAVTLIGISAFVYGESRILQRELKRLEAMGIRRRSEIKE